MEATLEPLTRRLTKRLLTRAQPDSGFAFDEPTQGPQASRPDATVWASLALGLGAHPADAATAGLDWLAARQSDSGQIVHEEDDQMVWLTSLACLAFQASPAHGRPHKRALEWLLGQRGITGVKGDTVMGHDTGLRGWPFMGQTHSWIEPTSMVMLVHTLAGQSTEAQAVQALGLVLDRQLPAGGWNYGNTTVFGNTLRPLVHTTGVALSGLAGLVPGQDVEKSRAYLVDCLPHVRTPLSLSWGVLGLAAWGQRPDQADRWLGACEARQDSWGPYNTEMLAILLLASRASEGLLAALRGPNLQEAEP